MAPDDGPRSLTAVEDAWRAEPARIDLACALYDALVQRHASGQAAEVMREVIARVPESVIAHFRLSERLVVLGEPAEAARHLQRVVEAPVVDIDDWLYRSLALARLGRRAESEASAHHYVTLRPGHAHGTFHLVSLLLDAGGFDESATLLGESIELSGGEAAVLATLVLRLRLARPAAGDALMTRLVALCDGDAQAMLRDVSRRRRRGGASS